MPEERFIEPQSEFVDNERLTSRMLAFLDSKGGRVNFADFMMENLYSEEGYFTKRVDLDEAGDFSTLAQEPVFAQMMDAYLKRSNVPTRDFLELAGGTGAFKRQYLNLNPDAHYISLDISPKMSELQANQGGAVNKNARAENLDFLPDSSVEGVVFANELLDNLPTRLFSFDRRHNVFFENYIKNNNGKIGYELDAPADDEDFALFKEYLFQKGRLERIKQTDIMMFCMPTTGQELASSLDRVLSKGKIILCDYGFEKLSDSEPSSIQAVPYFLEKIPGQVYTGNPNDARKLRSWPNALEKPYQTDLTYLTNFDFYFWLFKKQNPKLKINLSNQENFFPPNVKQAANNSESLERYNGKIKLAKGGFKVLEVTK